MCFDTGFDTERIRWLMENPSFQGSFGIVCCSLFFRSYLCQTCCSWRSLQRHYLIFSCASAKAERSLSSLSCVCVYVDQNKETPPPGFHGSVPKCYTTFVWLQICPWPKRPPSPAKLIGAYGNATPLLKPIFPTPDLTWPKRPPQPNCHGCIQSCYTSFTKGNFFDYRFDWTNFDPPPPKFHGCNLSHYTCVKWYFRSMQIWLDVFDPPPKFHRCILSHYTYVKWYFRSMQIWLDVFDPPHQNFTGAFCHVTPVLNDISDLCRYYLTYMTPPPTKISQVQFVTLHLLNDILDLCRFDLTYLTPLPKFYGCISSCYTTTVQPISIQPLQTQQKPRVTEAQHNAERHFLFYHFGSTTLN